MAATFSVSSARCESVGRPGCPAMAPLWAMNRNASTNSCNSSSLGGARPGPGREQSLNEHQQRVGGERKQDREPSGGDQLGLEGTLPERGVDRDAETGVV